MLIVWNQKEKSFELKFKEFKGDLQSAKAAKFKTTGAPDWVWYSLKAKPLKYLQDNRPASGLEITKEALEKFNHLIVQEEKNDELKKKAKKEKAKAKKRPLEEQLNEIGLKASIKIKYKYQPPEPPKERCIYCQDPVYEIYEAVNPLAVCIWCEKTIQDNQGE